MQDLTVTNGEVKINRNTHLLIISILPVIFLIMAFIFDKPVNIFQGLYEIILAPDILLTDYLAVGGLGAALFNVSSIVLINIFIIYKLNIKINGAIIAAIFTLTGFAFFGKNIFNIWPMYLGGILYARYKKISFEQIAVVIMFSTCLAPVVSQLAFSSGLPYFSYFLKIHNYFLLF